MIKTKTRDLLIVWAVAVVGLILSIRFDAFEGLVAWVQRYEEWQVDELFFLPIFLAILLLLYYRRRRGELRQQKDLYEGMLKIQSELGEGFVILDDQRVWYANEAFCKISGYGLAGLRSLPGFMELVPEEERASIFERQRRRLGGEVETHYDTVLRHKHGHKVDIEVAFRVLDEDGKVVVIVRDITERKRAENKLREAEERYRTLVEKMPAVTYVQEIADPGSNKTSPTMYASPQIEAQSGYPPQAFVEDPELWAKLLHPGDRERVLAEDARTDETGEPFRIEYRQIARDGRITWLRDEATLVRDEEGNPSYWLGVQVDITELKRAEETLQEANRRLEELAALRADFTAMVAHEIGTPLATIRGFLEMLATGELEPADQADALDRMRAESDRLSTLVADVRSAAAIEQGEFGLMFRRTSVRELLDDAVRFAETLPGNHRLNTAIMADGQVRVDPYRIGQVLRNLLSNAAKYSPEGAPIELRVRSAETSGRIRIEVVDRGVGIHPDDVERIFEKFGRGRDESGRRKMYGVGLGLYLSRRIVRDHGSELTLDPAPGGGSIFSFELEVAR
jgi:PAS domain S-box-containing protein